MGNTDLNNIYISIVVPVYNSTNTLGHLYEALNKVLKNAYSNRYEIILVNDGSSDSSWDLLKSICLKDPNVVGINFFKNFGQISALMAGIRFSRGKFVITLDDDLQNPPDQIPNLVNELESGIDYVYAIPESRQDSLVRKVFSFMNEKTLCHLARKPKDLVISSFLGMSQKMAKELVGYSGPFPYIAGLIFRISLNGKTIKVKHNSRFAGRSNYNLRRLVRLYLNGVTNFSIIPLRISLFFGFIIALLSTISGLLIILLKVCNYNFQAGWPSLISLISFLSSFILISIGIIGEYVGRIFFILNSQPQYCIREVLNRDV